MKTLRILIFGLLALVPVMQPMRVLCQSQPSAPVAEVITPEIQALADGLQDDPLRMYNYVHDHIRYVLYFGSKKGAELTLLEKSGNDFDQCALLVAMLRAAGYTNNMGSNRGVGYQFGWEFLPYDDFSGQGQDLHHWLNLTLNNTNWVYTYYYLNDLFFNVRGYPDAYPLNDGNTFMFQRVWVQLTLGSTNYYLDPAFKVSNPVSGVANLFSAMGGSSNALMSAASGTYTANYVTNLNEANLRSTLTGYTANLLNYLQSNYPTATPEQILGGWQIVPSTATALSTNTTFETYDWSGGLPILNWQYLPTNMMSTLKITFAGTSYQWFVPQLEGQRVTLTFDASGTAQLWQDDTLLAQHATSGSSSLTNVILYINHPDGTWDITNNVFIDTTVNDQTVTNSYQRTNSTYNIMYAFEPDWGWLQERQRMLDSYRQQGLSDTSRQVTSETLNVMGLSWMLQTFSMEQMLAPQLQILPQYFHRLGRMAQETGRGYYVDAYMEIPGAYPSDDDLPTQITALNNYYEIFSFFGSAMENGIIEQLQSTNLAGASSVKMLEIAMTNHQAVFMAYSGNWTAGYNVKSHLVANTYDSTTLATIGSLCNSNYFILLPQNGSNYLAGPGTWAGYGYAAFGNTEIMAINGGYHGGFSQSPVTVNPPFVQQTGDSQQNAFTQVGTGTTSPTSADPVDTADGTFQVDSTDLSLGQAEPRGITLSRYYNGTRRYSNPSGMAGGWIHNYAITANTIAAPQAGLCGTTPAQAAPMIAATYAAVNLFNGTIADPKNWMVTALISKWGVDQLTKNGASINFGKDALQFISQPNGTFTPPAGNTATLTRNNSAYSLQMRHGNKFNFSSQGLLTNIVDQYNQSLNLAYNASNWIYTVTDWKGRTLTFNYSGTPSQLTSVSDGTRTIYYGYSTAYSPQGDLTSFTDAEGKTTTYTYDANHQITATIDAQSRMVVSNAYNSQGRITRQYTQGDTNKMWQVFWSGWDTVELDPANGVNGYFYDDQGRLTTVLDPIQNETDYVYDGQNHLIYTVSPLFEINQFFYDRNHNLIQQIDPLGFTNQFIYDGNNNLVKGIDPRGYSSTFGYNAQFSLTGQTNGAGDFVNYAFNTDGTLHSRSDSGGTTLYDTYDSYGQLAHVTYPNSLGVEGFVNSLFGDVTSHTDPNGNVATFGYNNRRQLTNSVAPTNLVASIGYDSTGNPNSVTDARRNSVSSSWSATRQLLQTTLPAIPQGTPVVTNAYDSRNWLTKSVDPLNNPTLFTNDASGRLISHTDPLLRTTRFAYDSDGRRLATVNAANETNSQTWDSRGRPLKLTDGAGHFSMRIYDAAGNVIVLTNRNLKRWQFQFDGANRLTNTVTPRGYTTSVAFNHQGLVSNITDFASQHTSLAYDAKGRLTNRADNVATTLYGHDANNNVTSVVENGRTNSWTYDAYNRVSSYTDVNGNLIQYRFDANNNLTNLIYPGNRNVYYAYDSNNHMTNVTDWASRKTSIAYDLGGRLTSIARPNGTQRVISYDAAGQATNLLEANFMGFPLALFRYNWTNSGTIAWEFAAPLPHTNTPATRTMTYDDDNRLSKVDGNSVTIDSDGNLLSGPLTNDTFSTYTFDARNRLLNVGGVTNAYDAMNNRIGQAFGTNTSAFVVNPSASLPQVLMRIKNGVTNYYIYGVGLLYQVTETATTTNTLTYHYDYRGSTIALTDGNGNITDRMEYSLYATLTYHIGSSDTPFLFNGRFGVMTDPNGLLYMRSRYYSPFLCRFINQDPSGFSGGLNVYAFANGNPVSYLDPFGLSAQATGDSYFTWTMPMSMYYKQLGQFYADENDDTFGNALDFLGYAFDAYHQSQAARPQWMQQVDQVAQFAVIEMAPELSPLATDTAATETFYRTMSQANYEQLLKTGQIPATSETFISPSLQYAQQYNGVTVQFNVQAGTQNALMGMGVRNSAAAFTGTAYEGLPLVQSGWGSSSAFFKIEGQGLVNVGLGQGSALNTFNNSIINFNLVPKP
jgi:RHS repeat-associated protein